MICDFRTTKRKYLANTINMIAGSLLFTASAVADTIDLPSSKDNSIFSDNTTNSAGISPGIFAGTNTAGAIRRGLIAFDISSIPTGSTINDVKLTFNMHQAAGGGDHDLDIHVLTTDWNEGNVGGGGNDSGGGGGAPAGAGDPTWLSSSHPGTAWGTAGGDFVASSSATVNAPFLSDQIWDSAQMVTDVQSWLDNPGTNFGWMILGDESIIDGAIIPSTAKRLASKENNALIHTLPNLFIEYTLAPPTPTASAPLIGLPGLITLLLGFFTSGLVLIRRNK